MGCRQWEREEPCGGGGGSGIIVVVVSVVRLVGLRQGTWGVSVREAQLKSRFFPSG